MANGNDDGLLKTGMFAAINSSHYAQFGVVRGGVVYLAGESMIPSGAGDGYDHRKFFVCAEVNDGHVKPEGGFLADPKYLKELSKAKQDKLKAILEEDFGAPEEPEEDETTH